MPSPNHHPINEIIGKATLYQNKVHNYPQLLPEIIMPSLKITVRIAETDVL